MKILTLQHRDLILKTLSPETLSQSKENVYIVDTVESLPPHVHPSQCIVLSNGEGPEHVIAQAATFAAHHVLPVNHPYFASELQKAVVTLTDNQSFFIDPFATLLNKSDQHLFLSPLTVISSIKAKSQCIDTLVSDLQAHRPARTIWENVQSITDELLMNAIYDAPMMAGAGVGYPAELTWGYDSERFAVCVRDHFGSININAVLKRLQKVYSEGMGQAINMGSGGAGIGMRLIFDRCSSLHIAVEHGTQTLVCCVLNLNRSRRILESEEKSLHILEKKSA